MSVRNPKIGDTNDQHQNTRAVRMLHKQPTIALSPDGEVYIPAEKEHGISGITPEVSTTVPDRDIVLCIPVGLLDKARIMMSLSAQLMIERIANSTHQILRTRTFECLIASLHPQHLVLLIFLQLLQDPPRRGTSGP